MSTTDVPPTSEVVDAVEPQTVEPEVLMWTFPIIEDPKEEESDQSEETDDTDEVRSSTRMRMRAE